MAMAVAAGIKYKKNLLLKPLFSVSALRCMSRWARPSEGKINTTTDKEAEGSPQTVEQRRKTVSAAAAGCWMPHPRTGIYFPVGQEWVMDDIPTGAASFDCTFWLRDIEGVDHHKQDHHDFSH